MKIFRIFPKYILKDLLYDIKLKVWQDILSGNEEKICNYICYSQTFIGHYHFHRTIQFINAMINCS